MHPRFTPFFAFIASCFQEPPIEETVRQTFAEMSDVALRRVNPSQLTAIARPLWEQEMDRRRFARKGA